MQTAGQVSLLLYSYVELAGADNDDDAAAEETEDRNERRGEKR
jgi:hypothetical protein